MKALLIALFAALALLAVLFPAWALRRVQSGRRSRRADNVAAFRSRKAELDVDLETGRIDQATFEQLEGDAAAELLRDAQAEEGAVESGGRWMSVAAMIAVPAVAAGLYLASGGLPPMSHAEQMAGVVEQLEARVRAEPNDLDARRMLARFYMGTERYQPAAKLYREINDQTGGTNVEALIAEGEALGMARGQDWLGRPAALFDAALDIEPNNTRGLWYGSLSAAQDSKPEIALMRLQRLDRQELEEPLAGAVRRAVVAMGGVPADASSEPASAQSSAAPAESEPAGTRIALKVQLAPELQSAVPERFTLFVFAKQVAGPPMPLAAKRFDTPTFPLAVTLSSQDAMMQGLSLDSADRWSISARISRAGEARASSGDLQGQIELAREDIEQAHTIEINAQLP